MHFGRLVLLVTPMLSFFLPSCNNDSTDVQASLPQACFSTGQGDLVVNQQRFFDATCSKNYDSIRWYMGDGSIISHVSHNYAYLQSGDFTISVVAYKGNKKDSTTKIVKVTKPAIILHTQEAILKDVVWDEGVHEIDGFVSVVGGTLTIPPGTTIRMRPGAVFQVGTQSPSGLIAVGTVDKPITFTSSLDNPTPGSWNHVIVGQYKTQATFKYCTFQYGGSGPYSAMMVAQYAASFSAENCTFRMAANNAILLRDLSFFDLFQNNTISDIQGYAIKMNPYKIPTIGANNNISNKGILMETGTLDRDLTLTKQTTPFVFNMDVSVGSATGATLTVQPGTLVAFDNVYLRVGDDYNKPGKLIAAGTSTDSVKFISFTSTPWGGVKIGDYTLSESVMKYALLKNVGNNVNTDAVINIGKAPVTIQNSTFLGNKLYGVDFDDQVTLNSFSNNVIGTGTKYSMRISTEELPAVGKTNIFKTGKDVFLRAGNVTQANTVWQNLGVAYYVDNTFMVGSTDGTASWLPEAGITVRMKANTAIFIGNTGPEKGTVKAIGTSSAKITFTLATETATIDYPKWLGFTMYSYVGAETKFDYVTISGAQDGMQLFGTPAGLPVVSNSLFQDMTEYAIWATSSTPLLSNNTYLNCGWGTVKYQ